MSINSTNYSNISINSENYSKNFPTETTGVLLLGGGDKILLENGTDFILLEEAGINSTNFSSSTVNSTNYS